MSHKSEMVGPFDRGDTIINKHFTSMHRLVCTFVFSCCKVKFSCDKARISSPKARKITKKLLQSNSTRDFGLYLICMKVFFNSLSDSTNVCCLLMIFANSLDTDQSTLI